MPNISSVAVSSQAVLQKQMDTVAHNLSNMSTVGYRAQNMSFAEQMSRITSNEGKTSSVQERELYYTTESGTIRNTGNPLDVALEGTGFFTLIRPDGGMAYTRSASMRMNDDGVLVTGNGIQVSGSGGGPISIPGNATGVKITKEGKILSDQGELGALRIVEFENPDKIKSLGHGMYASAESPPPAAPNTVAVGGALEGSNVKPVLEMTKMIDISRSYQRTTQIISNEHERIRQVIRRLTSQ